MVSGKIHVQPTGDFKVDLEVIRAEDEEPSWVLRHRLSGSNEKWSRIYAFTEKPRELHSFINAAVYKPSPELLICNTTYFTIRVGKCIV